MTLASRAAHSLFAVILAGTLARVAHPQEAAAPPLSPAAAAALAAKVAHLQHVQQLLAARENGALQAPQTGEPVFAGQPASGLWMDAPAGHASRCQAWCSVGGQAAARP